MIFDRDTCVVCHAKHTVKKPLGYSMLPACVDEPECHRRASEGHRLKQIKEALDRAAAQRRRS